jgi:hypothetical protein
MKLKTVSSSKTAVRIQIVAAGVSGLSLLLATWISTLQVPCIQHTIDAKDATISKLRDQTTNDLVQGLYARDDYTDRRIDFLDVRLETVIVSSRSERKQSLLENAVSKTIDQISQWDSLFIREGTQPISTPMPVLDQSTSVEQRLVKLDPALSRARKNAYLRLKGLIDQIHAHESQKGELETRLNNKEVWFRLLQIFGLLSLAVAIVLESLKKCCELDSTRSKSDMHERVAEPDDEGTSSFD